MCAISISSSCGVCLQVPLTVMVTDVNDVAPTFTRLSGYAISVREDQPINFVITDLVRQLKSASNDELSFRISVVLEYLLSQSQVLEHLLSWNQVL